MVAMVPNRRRFPVYHNMYGNWGSAWDWLWMTLMVVFWLAVLGGVVYAAVRLAHQRQQKPPLSQ
jgi:ABC-type Fe3+ transport system permease subunit